MEGGIFMTGFVRKIEQFIRKHEMISGDCHIIAGVSGGPDSMCLLLVLLDLREVFGHTVSAVHVEHGIRGGDSMADAEFVRHFCLEQGIECHICHCCVPEYAYSHGMSEEEAGRKLRYRAFESEKKLYAEKYKDRDVKIAVAHNRSDNAETMLFHLARGTGVQGLAGIAPVRGSIIRPLLNTDREEIERFLAERQQDFCTDATNADGKYSRNQIRLQVLPVFGQLNSGFAQHMYQTAQQLRRVQQYMAGQAQQALQECCVLEHGRTAAVINKTLFEHAEQVIQDEMLYQLLGMLAGSRKDVARKHIIQLRQLFSRQNGRRIQLPHGLQAQRIYEGIEIRIADCLEKETAAASQDACWLLPRDALEREKTFFSPQGPFLFRLVETDSNYITQISKKKYTKSFDYDKIKTGVCVRTRQPGDYLAVNDAGKRQKLKKYFINEKIPAGEREQLLLLADGAHIMWVAGHRISHDYKVDEHTRRILEVTFCGGKKNERTD